MKHLMASFFSYSLHMSLTAGWEKTDYDFVGRNFLRLLCWEMNILKRLPGECGTPVCHASNVENVEKKVSGGKLSIVLVQKKTF